MTSWGQSENKPGEGAQAGVEWPIEAIIPSFREDDEDTASDGAVIKEYLEQLPQNPTSCSSGRCAG